MTQHEELIAQLRASAAMMPCDAAVAVQYNRAADLIESQSREIAALKEQEAELCTLYGLAEAECKRLRKDADRYAVVRRGQHWSVIDGIGDPLTGDRLDAGVDAVISSKGVL